VELVFSFKADSREAIPSLVKIIKEKEQLKIKLR